MRVNPDSAVATDKKREAQSFRSEVDGFLPLSRHRSAVLRGDVEPHSNDVRKRKMTLKVHSRTPSLLQDSTSLPATAESGINAAQQNSWLDVMTGWRALLVLAFERRGVRTVLASRRHDGSLIVQKPLYPEGDEVCHAIVVYPPAGIAGGDELQLTANVGPEACVLLTTPGAGKWYRSGGPRASQRIVFDVGPGACLEWLPQETIIFDGALADLRADVRLAGDGCFVGWEILCFGRTGSGERFNKGEFLLRTTIQRDGKPLWLERARLDGGDAGLDSAPVLAGQPVAGTLVAASLQLDASVLAACREVKPPNGDGAVTLLPGLLVGRYLGGSSEAAKNYFTRLWHVLRPALAGRTAKEPRIWST